jgi:ATP-dependent DNA helicase RecQ
MIENATDSLIHCSVLLDLETSQTGQILKIGAVRDGQTFLRSGRFDMKLALRELDAFASGAQCLVGHNVLRHDLLVLAKHQPDLELLQLPVVDTLFLSPICFPENPYHRLVKDYKLVSDSLNDPVADGRLAGVLLLDEVASLKGLTQTGPDFFRCLRFLLCEGTDGDPRLAAGMRIVFEAASDQTPPVDAGACIQLLPTITNGIACRTCAAAFAKEEMLSEQARWALAYVLTWLRVAGAESVLPPWVRLNNPQVAPLLSRLRDVPCDDPACDYCQFTHNPEKQLKQFFGFDAFRPTPPDVNGRSLQRAIVAAGMRNESLLAIMPTGGGKSLCFQLPALVRNFRRGQLTIIVSPLQALMKDQVDGLVRRSGVHNTAALYGMLTSPERGEVLRGISSGSISLLYVSPEQLRSRSFRKAASQREIGCWVLDEAHCLSKWGHDFRPDYLYVGRFIKDLADEQHMAAPAIACFTATAKREVIEEIVEYFRRETGSELFRYEGGVERDNLKFIVQTVGKHSKLPRIHDLLTEQLAPDGHGSAVVFRATRKAAEETAEFLVEHGWSAACFHAGLPVTEKKRIQDAFLASEIRVICATNAFGMGIDKDDVRLVIHGDTPGSLENYLQEAGRAGRDRNPAECVLLYDDEDCEQQFRMGANSELSRRDVAQILRGLRKAARSVKSDEVVITTGELLRDEDVETDFDAQDNSADTKVRAAISWLERAGFVERNENRTNVIQARLLVKSIEEAQAKLSTLNLSEREIGLRLAIIREMMNASETDTLSVDEIALLPEFQSYLMESQQAEEGYSVRESRAPEYLSAKILKVLDTMTGVGVLKKDTLLTAFIRYKVADHSSKRLERVLRTDREFLKILSEEAPDPEGWMPLNLRLVNDALKSRDVESSTEMLRQLLHSLSEDGRGFGGQAGSVESRFVGRDAYRVRVRRTWPQIEELAERRRNIASQILNTLLETIPKETPPKADLLIDFAFETLRSALEQDLTLRSDIRDMQAAIERGLMFLHEQNVITLQKGLAIFRSAMTIRVLPEAGGQRYTNEHYEALQHHYRERVFQVHVMNEYARNGIEKIQAALELVVAYFTMEKEAFISRFFGDSRDLLERATTARSYRAIVDSLGNRDQIRIVTQPTNKNLLILAGPGSGKTRTVVHRCAYLLRVKRVRPRAILVCCFNHKAALELRHRLADLAGKDAIGVTVQTYHGLALRILGLSCRGVTEREGTAPDFDKLITDAVNVLRGQTEVPGVEPDDMRDRLLAGFEHILVDEYQDIDEPQYEMISAIAGRTLNDGDRKLSILAVGDDDQSIYSFRGANVTFIKRFQADYEADVAYLVENYRSTRTIIEASNRLIAHNRDRMKTEKPIRIDRGRTLQPAGGGFGDRDELTRGRVAVVEVSNAFTQAASVVRELLRLRSLGVTAWTRMAVLSRTRRDLALVRAAAEANNIPVTWPLERDKIPPLHRIRELNVVLDTLSQERGSSVRASDLIERFCPDSVSEGENQWSRLCRSLLFAWREETADEPTPVASCVEFLYESLAQRRRDEQFGEGVILNTVHGAKGTEYPHVLVCGDWSGSRNGTTEEERRVLYVALTRARETLSVFNRMDRRNPFLSDFTGACFAHRRETLAEVSGDGAERDYTLLGLDDLHLDYAGQRPANNFIHTALAHLQCGNLQRIENHEGRLLLVTEKDITVARLSSAASQKWAPYIEAIEQVRVICLLIRYATDCKEPVYQYLLKVPVWHIPICEFVVRKDNITATPIHKDESR